MLELKTSKPKTAKKNDKKDYATRFQQSSVMLYFEIMGIKLRAMLCLDYFHAAFGIEGYFYTRG